MWSFLRVSSAALPFSAWNGLRQPRFATPADIERCLPFPLPQDEAGGR